MDTKKFSSDINDAMVFETREEAEAYIREHELEFAGRNIEVIQVADSSVTGNVQRIQ